MNPTRMPPYNVANDGTGPYAMFQCEQCGREYRTQPVFVEQVTQQVAKSALGGFLRNVPFVGGAAADQVESDQYRTSLTQEELDKAWAEVGRNFQECQACRQVVCLPDFDVQSDFCRNDSPRSTELAAREAEQAGAQAAAFFGGLANAFGVGDAVKAGVAQAQTEQSAQTGASACASCGSAVAAGAKFCANCGTPTAATCTSCGTAVAAGAKFCANCGTPVG